MISNLHELASEIQQRLPDQNGAKPGDLSSAALWIEPLAETWETDLNCIERALLPGAVLVIILSQPMARLLPERRDWNGIPLGFRLGGLGRLQSALTGAGFILAASYGIHTAFAIGLNILSQFAGRLGRPDLGDRLHFTARLHYCVPRLTVGLATVALLCLKKERA